MRSPLQKVIDDEFERTAGKKRREVEAARIAQQAAQKRAQKAANKDPHG